MDQLFAAFGIDWRLLIIQAVNFSVLLGVLTYFLYTPLMKLIDERREKIAEGVRAAEAAAQRLADAKAEGDELKGQAAREAESLLASARTNADEKGQDIIKTAESRADNLLKEAQERAEEAKRQAMLESQKDIARAAMLAAEKILREKAA